MTKKTSSLTLGMLCAEHTVRAVRGDCAVPVWGGSESLSDLGLPESSSVAMVLWMFWYLQDEQKHHVKSFTGEAGEIKTQSVQLICRKTKLLVISVLNTGMFN